MLARFTVLALAAVSVLITACGDSSGGGAQKTAGHLKEGIGSLTGDSKLKREGKKDEVVGGVKETVQDTKDAVHDATH